MTLRTPPGDSWLADLRARVYVGEVAGAQWPLPLPAALGRLHGGQAGEQVGDI